MLCTVETKINAFRLFSCTARFHCADFCRIFPEMKVHFTTPRKPISQLNQNRKRHCSVETLSCKTKRTQLMEKSLKKESDTNWGKTKANGCALSWWKALLCVSKSGSPPICVSPYHRDLQTFQSSILSTSSVRPAFTETRVSRSN